MSPRNFGGPYPSKVYRPYRGAQLAPAVRTGERKPAEVTLTPTRRGLLEAVAADKVRYSDSRGWVCERRVVNAVMQDCARAGWVAVKLFNVPPRRRAKLTDLGRKAIGIDEVGA